MAFHSSLSKLTIAVDNAIKNNVCIASADDEKAIYDFEKKKEQYFVNAVKLQKKALRQDSFKLHELISYKPENEINVAKILALAKELDKESDLHKIRELINKMDLLNAQLKLPPESNVVNISKSLSFPEEIRDEMNADLKELDLCHRTGCYRSAIIICGRLLETALHRKYFDSTGIDLLEKSPGIGLGKIIAHFDEKGISLDPAMKQQIHLINQVRIFSVHKKQEVFYPSREQAHAIILYTIDVLGRIFTKN